MEIRHTENAPAKGQNAEREKQVGTEKQGKQETQEKRQDRPTVTRAEKVARIKTIVRGLLEKRPYRWNELLEATAKEHVERFPDDEDANSLKGRIGSALDLMEKAGETRFEAGVCSLADEKKASVPSAEKESEGKKNEESAVKAGKAEKQTEKQAGKGVAARKKAVKPMKAEKAEGEVKPDTKRVDTAKPDTAVKSAAENAEQAALSAPVLAETKKSAPGRRGRKPAVKTLKTPVESAKAAEEKKNAADAADVVSAVKTEEDKKESVAEIPARETAKEAALTAPVSAPKRRGRKPKLRTEDGGRVETNARPTEISSGVKAAASEAKTVATSEENKAVKAEIAPAVPVAVPATAETTEKSAPRRRGRKPKAAKESNVLADKGGKEEMPAALPAAAKETSVSAESEADKEPEIKPVAAPRADATKKTDAGVSADGKAEAKPTAAPTAGRETSVSSVPVFDMTLLFGGKGGKGAPVAAKKPERRESAESAAKPTTQSKPESKPEIKAESKTEATPEAKPTAEKEAVGAEVRREIGREMRRAESKENAKPVLSEFAFLGNAAKGNGALPAAGETGEAREVREKEPRDARPNGRTGDRRPSYAERPRETASVNAATANVATNAAPSAQSMRPQPSIGRMPARNEIKPGAPVASPTVNAAANPVAGSVAGRRYRGRGRAAQPAAPLTPEEALKAEFLRRLRSLGGDYFEYYSVYLLERYSMRNGRRLESMRVSGGERDGGIDGEITLTDKLGFRETIYIQAKNWDPSKGEAEKWVVGETLLQQFIGAVACRQAKDGTQHGRGIFVTTSLFTPEAKALLETMSDKFVGYDASDVFDAAKECAFGLKQVGGEWTLDEALLEGEKAFFNIL